MKADEKVAMASGTVARGRTVVVPHPTEKDPCGTHPITFEPMFIAKTIEHGPGAEVTLPATEIAWLRDLGFLVDPNKIALVDISEPGGDRPGGYHPPGPRR